MKTIQINDIHKHDQYVFLHVVKGSSYYQLHQPYHILDVCRNFVSRYFIHSIKEIKLEDIDDETAMLAKNCNAEIFKHILKKQHSVAKHDVLFKVIFSKNRPIVSYD